MPVKLYMDEHINGAITQALLSRGVDVLRVQDDGYMATPDEEIFDHATDMGRVIYTNDSDYLIEATRRFQAGIDFPGVIYNKPDTLALGKVIDNLELIAKVYEPADLLNYVEFLPL